MNRRQPVTHIDIRHSDAAASQASELGQRRRLGIPEPFAPKPLPAVSSADVQHGGKAPVTNAPPAPGRAPVPPPPDRGGRSQSTLTAEEIGYVNAIVASDYARRVLR